MGIAALCPSYEMITDVNARKLDYLRQSTGRRVSDVIKEAIDLYYEKVRATPSRPADVLTSTGFVACGEADPDLSESYKKHLNDSLADKHGDR